ncbi:MAG: hypothetical protein GY858_00480, partial [Candidatus Omnitrophica bacterium]|nr:hypothetical protein [Candidatus Omnitrophota bacterium]
MEAAVSSIHFRSDCSSQGNLHNIPHAATVSKNRYFNENVASIGMPESLNVKSFELSGWSAHVLSLSQSNEQTVIQRRMPQQTNKYQRTRKVAGEERKENFGTNGGSNKQFC